MRPFVRFQPERYLQSGINQICDAIRPTMGPLPRVVAISQSMTQKSPELLDNGGTIARRIVQLPERSADAGAMFIRHMLWRVHEEAGDGTAAAAMLFQSIYNEGLRYLAAGGNAMRLRSFLEHGMSLILDQLEQMTIPVAGRKPLANVAESLCHDAELAQHLGEIFDIIGDSGQLDIREGYGRALHSEYVDGSYWEQGIISREILGGTEFSRAEIHDALVLICDLKIESPHDLMPILEQALQADVRKMLVVAHEYSDTVKGFLISNWKRNLFQTIAVKIPGSIIDDQRAFMEDIAVLTGGRPIYKATGQTLETVRLGDLGRARRIWANAVHFGVVAGKSDPAALRQHIANLRMREGAAPDADTRRKLQQRLGKLNGGSATLFLGGATDLEVKSRKELAQRSSQALRGAVRAGVVPGGGVALLNCQAGLKPLMVNPDDTDERAAYRILHQALETPLRTIVSNAGSDPGAVLADCRHHGLNFGWDARSEQVVNVVEAGIFDVSTVVRSAAAAAISSAALALTVDVLVHHKKPEETVQP